MNLWTLEITTDSDYNIIGEKLRKRDRHYVEDGDGANFWYILNRRHTYSIIYDSLQKKKRFGGGWIYSIPTKYVDKKIVQNMRKRIILHINCDKFKYTYEKFVPEFSLRDSVIKNIMGEKILKLDEIHKGCEFLHSISFCELMEYEMFIYKEDEHCTQITFDKPTRELKTLDGVIVGYSYSGDILRIGIYKQK